MKQRFPHPRIVATRKALAARPPAPLERILEQAAASRRWTADQLRESRSKHLLTNREDAEKQMRAFRAVLPITSPPFTRNS